MKEQLLSHSQTIKTSQKTLSEQVADQISEMIIEQHIMVGAKLPNEFEIAHQLNVGRGTVREAIKLLVSRNVLEVQKGRGTFVANNTGMTEDPFGFAYLEDEERLARELFQIRLQMEPWIAALAAESATEENIKQIKKRQKEVEENLLSGKNYLPSDQQFHISIADCTQNRVLPMLIPVITYSVHLFGKLLRVKRLDETIETHQKIVESIESHNPEAAKNAMTEHLLLNMKAVPFLEIK